MKLYFIGTTIGGFLKIGISRDPEKRLSILTQSGPFELALLAVFESQNAHDVIRAEAEIHSALHAHRARGEWYLLTEPVAALAKFAQRTTSLRDVVAEAKRQGELKNTPCGGQFSAAMLRYCAFCGAGKPILENDLNGAVAVLAARQHRD